MNKNEVVLYFGNQSKLAEALGISKASVSQWGSKIPVRRAYEIERLTNGQLKVKPTIPAKTTQSV